MDSSYNKEITTNLEIKPIKINNLTERTNKDDIIINSIYRKKSSKGKKIKKKINSKINNINNIEYIAYNNLKKKYNYNSDRYNLLCVNYLLRNVSCHLVSEFKEKMITDYIDEFIGKEYNIKEIKVKIPKFYLYYKHYSIFFGKPFLKNFSFNHLLQKNGEKKARIYYKNHYQNGESKDEENENLAFAESKSGDENDDDCSDKCKKNKLTHIFDSSIKENIDNVTLMTTINSIENNTINLKINNEKIEIFSENKKDKSNDTTLGDIINYINNKDIEEIKAINKVSKVIKKKNYSISENILKLMNKNTNKKMYINENNKKKLFELINNNNSKSFKKKIKINSINKNIIKTQSIKPELALKNNTQRNIIHNKKNSIKLEKNRKKILSNYNMNSNRIYKKANILSLGDDEITKILKSNNNIRSPRCRNIKFNNNKNIKVNSIDSNRYFDKIKIAKTFKNITDRNIKKNYVTESQLIKQSKKKKKVKIRKYISPINNKNINFDNKTLANDYTNRDNLPFSMGKKNIYKKKINNNTKLFLSNLSYQTINHERIHQRTKSNNLDNHLMFSKGLITDRYNIYNKPYIRINKNENFNKDVSELNHDIKTSINENYNNKISYNSISELKNFKEQNKYKKKIQINNINNNNKKSNFSKYIMDVIKKGNNKYSNLLSQINQKNNLTHNCKGNKDILQIALSLLINENSSRIKNFNTKINNNQNNQKKNYNLNININNEININENSNINNSTYSINNYTQRVNTKNINNINNKNIINLKKTKNNNTKETLNSYRNNHPSYKANKINKNNLNMNINNKKIRKRNPERNLYEALTSINNNIVNTFILNNSIEGNKNINNKNKIFKNPNTKSISSLTDLMNHNKNLISKYKNLNKNK